MYSGNPAACQPRPVLARKLILELTASPKTEVTPGVPLSDEYVSEMVLPVTPSRPTDELFFEIGLWLCGLESCLSGRGRIARDTQKAGDPEANWVKEFRLSNTALLIIAELDHELRRALVSAVNAEPDGSAGVAGISPRDC